MLVICKYVYLDHFTAPNSSKFTMFKDNLVRDAFRVDGDAGARAAMGDCIVNIIDVMLDIYLIVAWLFTIDRELVLALLLGESSTDMV